MKHTYSLFVIMLLFNSLQCMQSPSLKKTLKQKRRRNSSEQQKWHAHYIKDMKEKNNHRSFVPKKTTPLKTLYIMTPYWHQMKKTNSEEKIKALKSYVQFYRAAGGFLQYRARLDIAAAIEIGTKQNAITDARYNPLFQSVTQNDIPLAQFLLTHKANPNLAVSHAPFPSVIFAAKTVVMAALLLKHNANPEVTCKLDETLLHHVINNQEYSDDLIKLYGEKINVNQKDGDRHPTTPLVRVIGNYYEAITDPLGISKEFDITLYIEKLKQAGAQTQEAITYTKKCINTLKDKKLIDSDDFSPRILTKSDEEKLDKDEIIEKLTIVMSNLKK